MKGWLDKYNDGKVAQADATRTKNTKNLGIKKGSDQPIGNMLDITLGAPQRQAVKMITGKEQSPSEAMDIQNPYGAFAADAILDPVNLIGAGIAGKIAKASTETGLLSKAYKLNPWAFKPNEANWYRQVGKSAIDDAFDTRLIREVGEEVSPRMWGEFQDQIKRLQGDDALGHEERMMQKILASRRPISPFFAKGELFYPMGRKEIITKSGKISKNSAGRGNADYLIETALPNESFQPAFVKGMSLGVPDMVGSTAILKPNPSLRDVSNFQLYKQDWLQGYKKLPKKENGGWLDKYNDGGPVQENYNDYSVSAPEGFQGDGYSNVGRDYSPAWGGQFEDGGELSNTDDGNWLNKLISGIVYPYGGFGSSESEYKIDNSTKIQLGQQFKDKKITFDQYKEKVAQAAHNKEGRKLSETWNRNMSMPNVDPANINASYDALYMHQGLPQKYNSFIKSQYKPSTSKDPNSIYYSLSPSLEKEILEDLTLYQNKDFIKSAEKTRMVKGSLVGQAALKNFKYSKGKDDKGDYISYYDVNDYGNILDLTGKPFEIYNRIYLDPKTGKPKMAMGGSMPGAVGFTYARTNDPAPSKGKYAKKTMASAQNGTEMRYYQEGLDFKPKSISRDGSQLVKLDQLTNFTNYNTKQPGGWLDKYEG
jgi:hypothetical protein